MNCDTVEEILTMCEEFVPGDPPEFFFDRSDDTDGDRDGNTNRVILK